MTHLYNFLPIVLTFMGLLSLALLASTLPKFGKYIAYYMNLFASGAILVLLDTSLEYQLSELFFISGTKIKLILVVGFFNILMTILNGCQSIERVRNSLLISFMYLGSIFFIGSTELMTFFVSIEMISLIGYVLVSLAGKEYSKEAAVKYFVQGSVMSAIMLLGMAFFFVSTRSMSFMDITVYNHELYGVSLALLLIVTCFKIGAFPFHAWMPDVYGNVDHGNMASNFLITKLVIGYGMITLLQKLLGYADPQFQRVFIYCLLGIAMMSAVYGNVIGLAQDQFKRIIAYSSVAHAGYMLMAIGLSKAEGLGDQLMFYLVFYSMGATGALLLINNFIAAKNGAEDTYDSLAGGFYKYGLSAFALCLFVLSLAGMPLTSGFTTKYLLFVNYFKEGLTMQALIVLITTVIGLAYYIRFVVVLFIEKNETLATQNQLNGPSQVIELGTIRSQVVLFFFAAMILAGGLAPSLFFKW